MSEKKSLYIIDIFSFIFRAYYAIRPLSAPDGTPVNAVYGVASMMNKLIVEKKPDHICVCYESKDGNFRNEIYPEYKANRAEPPEDLIPQIDLIKEYMATFPIKSFEIKGFEADDVIATLAFKFAKEKDMEVFIVSSDKDLMQLVSDKDQVVMYDTMKNKIITEKDVVEKFGVGPEKVIDIQSLCGDSTDNIPGIPGVGPKTAAKLIQDYGSLEAVLNHATDLKGKLSEKVAEGRELALLSKKLVSLDKNIPLQTSWQDLAINHPDQEKLNAFYKRLNFKTLIHESKKTTEKKPVKLEFKSITLNDAKKCREILLQYKKLDPIPFFAFDTETDSIVSQRACLVGFSFCFAEDVAYYVPLKHKEGLNLSMKDFKEIFAAFLQDKKYPKIAQNAKYDINVLGRHGIEICPLKDDTLIASYLTNPEGTHNLDALSLKYLNHDTIKFADLVKKDETFADVPIEKATQYAAEDAWTTLQILNPLKSELKDLGLTSVYQNIEVPLIGVLSKMETDGILVDQNLLKALKKDFESRLKDIEKKIYKLAGEEFNINSPKQLAEILFGKLKLPVQKKTKTGFSTNVDVLEALAHLHDLPKSILDYRLLTKLNSTYVEQLTKLIHPETQRIHTSFNQAIVATGRLSSTDPNLQNIPIKTFEGKKIREVFIAPKGSLLFSADYSQIELRLLASFSKDPHLIQVYQNNEDVHKQTAAHLFGVEIKDVTDEMRNMAKTVNFGVVYGQSPFGLSQQLGIPQKEAKRFIDGFYDNYANVKNYREELLKKARHDGFVTTYLGRRRFVPEINSQNFMAKQNAERIAFNTVLQGSAADLIKKAMIEIAEFFQNKKCKTKMLLQVHDELVFEVPQDELEIIEKQVPQIMESAFKLCVPIKVSFNSGKNWAEAH